MATFNLSGRNQYNELFGLHLMDPLAGGFGAFADHDGQSAAGPINTPSPSIADVEVNEQKTPLVYLYRRLAIDTGGAGRRRGGTAAEIALTVAVPETQALVMTHGAEVPNSIGLSGGLPGSTVRQSFAQGSSSNIEHSLVNLGPKPGAFPLRNTDVFAVTWQGGGGVGDPLDRTPSDVLDDVRQGVVSEGAALDVYGVVLQLTEGGRPSGWLEDETLRLRREVRATRLGCSVEDIPLEVVDLDPAVRPTGVRDGEGWLAFSDRLRAIRDVAGQWRVETVAGAVLSVGSTRWRDGARAFPIQLPSRVGDTIHDDLTTTGWLCPVSGHLLSVDIHRKDQEPFHDLDLDLSADGRASALLAH
jgi:N-methylhydantoinase B